MAIAQSPLNYYLQLVQDIPDSKLDIVFVHGETAPATETWTHQDGTFWPSDYHVLYGPFARVFLFSYNRTSILSAPKNMNTLFQLHAETLLQFLKNVRGPQERSLRPVIFITHGVGRIIVQMALLIAKRTRFYQDLKLATYGVVCFARPYRYRSSLEPTKNISPLFTQRLVTLESNLHWPGEDPEECQSEFDDHWTYSFVEHPSQVFSGNSPKREKKRLILLGPLRTNNGGENGAKLVAPQEAISAASANGIGVVHYLNNAYESISKFSSNQTEIERVAQVIKLLHDNAISHAKPRKEPSNQVVSASGYDTMSGQETPISSKFSFADGSSFYFLADATDSGSRSIKETPNFDQSTLLLAIQDQNYTLCKWLLEIGYSADETTFLESADRSFTPLQLAVRLQNIQIVDLLLHSGAAIDLELLHESINSTASSANMADHIISLLAIGPVEIDRLNRLSGDAAIHAAVKRGNEDIVRSLLEHGANANVPNARGWRPLHYAVKMDSFVIMEKLFHHGANLSLPTQWDGNIAPLHIARSALVATFLLSHGASPNPKSTRAPDVLNTDHPGFIGITPLLIAAATGREDIAAELLPRLSADEIDSQTLAGITAEAVSLQAGNYKICRMIREAYRKVSNGRTPSSWEVQEALDIIESPIHIAPSFSSEIHSLTLDYYIENMDARPRI